MKKILTILLFTMLATAETAADFLLVPVKDTIDGGLAAFIDRAVQEARAKQMEGIIFHIDSQGGRIDSAVHIRDTILKAGVTTVAFVDKSAISAGALISLACDSLYMSTGSSIGAATAVDLQGKKAPEKIISYFRAQMRATAQAKGRRPDIAEAMVDEQIEVQGLTKKGMLLTLTYKEALNVGYSDGTVDSIDGVLDRLGRKGAAVAELKLNWAEQVVRVLTHPLISSLLISLGFIGLLVEIKTPGWGLGGTLALIALALFFGSHYIVKLAGIIELLLFIAGVILLAVELFILPGFGIAGFTGIALILLSMFLSLLGNMPVPEDVAKALYIIGCGFLAAIAAGFIIIRLFPKTPLFSKITLDAVESAQAGYTSIENRADLVGQLGVALSSLRPAGAADINGRRMDVVTEGGYIEKDTPVIVTEVHGTRIVVREAERT